MVPEDRKMYTTFGISNRDVIMITRHIFRYPGFK